MSINHQGATRRLLIPAFSVAHKNATFKVGIGNKEKIAFGLQRSPDLVSCFAALFWLGRSKFDDNSPAYQMTGFDLR
jgi:hypothetical protein